MACEQSLLQLHGYFDGELDALSASAFERHLETCADCHQQSFQRKRRRLSLMPIFVLCNPVISPTWNLPTATP